MDYSALHDAIRATPFVDTHEHLLEERTRLSGPGSHPEVPCTDAALLFWHYARSDFEVAGMPAPDRAKFFAPDVDPAEKWSLIAPYWARCRTTGYLQAARWAARRLFGERDVDADSFVRIGERMRDHARPGFYRAVLAAAGVESCQVNSFEAVFCETEMPDLLLQDLDITVLSLQPDLGALAATTGIRAAALDDMHAIIDWHFERYGSRAVAVKNSGAYWRRLDFADVPATEAAPLFARYAREGQPLHPSERKALQDHLVRYCVGKAAERGLPVKLHCGYQSRADYMPLGRVRRNAGDLCPLLHDFPEATFVLMHIGYPYQDEYIAMAKHYTNAYVDLCWAWIINPAATARFVREFLLAAPASKLFTFGGDYSSVEPIVGQAHMARQGLGQALEGLTAEGWITFEEAIDMVEPLMAGNARRVFRLRERTATP